MKITKATRWRVFAGVWIQSLFTSATAFFSLFALPLTGQFGWSSSEFSMAYTIYMFIYCAMGFGGGLLAEKLQPRVAIYIGLAFFAAGWFLTGFASSIPRCTCSTAIMAGCGRRHDLPGLPAHGAEMVPRQGRFYLRSGAGRCVLRPLHHVADCPVAH